MSVSLSELHKRKEREQPSLISLKPRCMVLRISFQGNLLPLSIYIGADRCLMGILADGTFLHYSLINASAACSRNSGTAMSGYRSRSRCAYGSARSPFRSQWRQGITTNPFGCTTVETSGEQIDAMAKSRESYSRTDPVRERRSEHGRDRYRKGQNHRRVQHRKDRDPCRHRPGYAHGRRCRQR
jgi:hypothetical protein